MDVDLGTDAAGTFKHTRICDDKRIRSEAFQRFEIIVRIDKIFVMSKYIGGNMYFYTVGMGILYAFFKFFDGKIVGFCPESVSFTAHKDRIGSVCYRCFNG